MTIWQKIYLILGGGRPNEPSGYDWQYPPFPETTPGNQLAPVLLRFGFLKRDAQLAHAAEASYYYNMLWQWRFWRGPYREFTEVHFPHLNQLGWWAIASGRWS